jgi:hypothetical protein
VIDEIHFTFDEEVIRDIILDELESWITRKMCDVFCAAGNQIVNANDGVPFSDQPIAQMRAEEAGSAGDYRCGHWGPGRFWIGE